MTNPCRSDEVRTSHLHGLDSLKLINSVRIRDVIVAKRLCISPLFVQPTAYEAGAADPKTRDDGSQTDTPDVCHV